MSYRDEDGARAARADALITEIATLERAKVARSELEHRLDSARQELALLQATPAPPPARPQPPGLSTHILVFLAAAAATFTGYTLLF